MRDLDPIFLEERITKLEKNGGSEEIEHLTEAIESVDNSLIANVDGVDTHFYFDYQNGKLGLNTDEERGADTFYPFKSNGFKYAITTDSIDSYSASLKYMSDDEVEHIIHHNKSDEFIDNEDFRLYYSSGWKLELKKDFLYYEKNKTYQWNFTTVQTFILI